DVYKRQRPAFPFPELARPALARVATIASALAAAALLLLSCREDSSLLYPGGNDDEDERIQAPAGEIDASPTLSDDTRFLAWWRHALGVPHPPYLLLRRDRALLRTDTLYVSSIAMESLDISPAGDLIAWNGNDSYSVLLIRPASGSHLLVQLPSGYRATGAPRWLDAQEFLFGADGPVGRGVYACDATTQAIRPVAVDIKAGFPQWLGGRAAVDPSGRVLCQEGRDIDGVRWVLLCAVDEAPPRLIEMVDGTIPTFWTAAGNEEGLMYLDRFHHLIALRRATGERFPIFATTVSDYDLTPDGRWVFTNPTGQGLVLHKIQDDR
ncbi:MAG: hypothetical protein QUU85_17410, partial [Candidatus Eisenbacteria bacterium]|nr:hypothetical protein [Candidatus Eisenbacteria bacterium]